MSIKRNGCTRGMDGSDLGIITGPTTRSSPKPEDVYFNPFHCQYWRPKGSGGGVADRGKGRFGTISERST